ncbi:hypothetical protein [Chondromyces crocatus]|uniref:Uncharacterized protein n=1 Tax=Chondromyces crocatus TaxID=52 RepID=A0A0K1EHW4_CHOCO|nr:hypothetical protein [Chondromyces crocatus]AKT40449.1 uncharacterized protein CMC5_046040 [Chondromyces crocatus]
MGDVHLPSVAIEANTRVARKGPTPAGACNVRGAMGFDERPLVEQIDAICALDRDPVLRNLLITQCYFELSEGLGELLGYEDANWCTFATWASKTAGRFIRKEDCPELFRRLLGVEDVRMDLESRPPPSSLDLFGPPSTDLNLFELPERILEEVSKMIAKGNLLVFAEIGPMFARMLDIYGGTDRPTDEMLAAAMEPLKVGPTPEGGQDLLRSALTHYHRAILAEDPDEKAEQMLLGNARVGLHEQTRLQPYIKGSLNAPVRRLLRTVTPGRLPGLLQSAMESLLKPIAERAGGLWRELATREMMRLRLPTGYLQLGHDLPVLPGQPLYPEYLRTIEDPELHELLSEYGAHDSTSLGCGASDWAYLPARMGYILELFRSRQCDPTLRGRPFSPEQEALLLGGQVPAGSL